MNFYSQMILLLVLLFSFSCSKNDKTETVVRSDKHVRIEKYNKLLNKHNKLVKDRNKVANEAWDTSNTFIQFLDANEKMSRTLELFADAVLRYLDFENSVKVKEFDDLKELYEEGSREILTVETLLLQQFNDFYELAPNIYVEESYFANLKINKAAAISLTGVRSEHQALWKIVLDNIKTNASATKKDIILNEVEEYIGQTSSGQGYGIGTSLKGGSQIFDPEEFKIEALSRGFSVGVIEEWADYC